MKDVHFGVEAVGKQDIVIKVILVFADGNEHCFFLDPNKQLLLLIRTEVSLILVFIGGKVSQKLNIKVVLRKVSIENGELVNENKRIKLPGFGFANQVTNIVVGEKIFGNMTIMDLDIDLEVGIKI